MINGTSRVAEQNRLRYIEAEIRRARLKTDYSATGICQIVIDQPAKSWISESKRSTDSACPRSSSGVERAIRTARCDISLIEALEDEVRRIWIVKVEALSKRHRLQQLRSLRSHVTYLNQHILAQLILRSDVPLLNVRRAQVAIDRAEFKSLCDVTAYGQPRRGINWVRCSIRARRYICAVTELIGPARTGSTEDAVRQVLIEWEIRVLARERRRDWNRAPWECDLGFP
jgi:hypothetical protein